MRKTIAAAKLAASSKSILVAVGELKGGVRDKKGELVSSATLAHGEELTDAKREAIGLDDAAVEDLVARGKLVEVQARVAQAVGAGELAEAIERAEAAEAKVEELEAEVADLKSQLEAATKPAQ